MGNRIQNIKQVSASVGFEVTTGFRWKPRGLFYLFMFSSFFSLQAEYLHCDLVQIVPIFKILGLVLSKFLYFF